MATRKTKHDNTALAAGIGAAALAAAAAGAGYYFYASKDAKKHRQGASRWAKGLKREVVKRAKLLKKIDADAVASAVDEAVTLYEGVRGVSAKDLRAAAKELKSNWKKVKGEVSTSARTGARRAKATGRKTARKVTRKSSTAGTRKRRR